MGTYGLSYGDLWKQSTEAEFPDPVVDFWLEKSQRVEMGPCTEPTRSTSRAQLPPRPATSPSLDVWKTMIVVYSSYCIGPMRFMTLLDGEEKERLRARVSDV